MTQRPYEKLIAWKEADTLCLFTYMITKNFPKEERFGLTSQMRRSGYSVPMNIAEGNVRRSRKDKAHFFVIAPSSLEELHYQYHLAKRLQYISEEDFLKADDRINKVSYLLSRLRSKFLKT